MSTELIITENQESVRSIVQAVQNIPVMKEEDVKFLMEKSEHLGKVNDNTFMWRTDFQKESIINDTNHPTTHSKFHQAILEQKVQLEQTLYLAKDFENKVLDVEELECDLEELEVDESISKKRKAIKAKRINRQIDFAQYELKQLQVAMKYRMAEVRGWQVIEERLIEQMKAEGYTEEQMWNREEDEIEDLFFKYMITVQGINRSTDGGEYNNLIMLAKYAYLQAKQKGLLEGFLRSPKMNDTIRGSINLIETLINNGR